MMASCEAPALEAAWAAPLLSEWKETFGALSFPALAKAILMIRTTTDGVRGVPVLIMNAGPIGHGLT